MATKTWNGSDGAFSTNESWTPQFAPVSGDVAVINAGSVSATGSLPASLVINLNSSTNSNSTLALSNATLPISAQLNIVAGGTDAILTMNGVVTNKGKITATGASPGAASLRIDNAPGNGATSFVNSGSIQVSDTGLRVLAGNNPGNQFENDGLISIHSPSRTPQLAVMAANLVGAGTVVLGPYVTFDAVQAVGAAQTFVFEHGNGGTTTLRMDAGKLFGAAISGFTASSTIQLNSGRWDKASYASTGASSGLLTLSLNGTLAMSIPFKGFYFISSFKLQEGAPNGSSRAVTTIVVDDPLFNGAYYLSHNPDVAAAGVDPYQHFMAYGWKEGRNPNAFFDLTYYRSQNPDVAAGGGNLLSHFEQYGWKEGRDPSLAFSDAKYLATYSDVKAANLNPLLHFQQYGNSEGRTSFLTGGTAVADLLVDSAYYDAQLGATIIPTGVPGQQQAAWSYSTSGAQRGLNPNAFFDTRYYLTQNSDVKASGMNPLTHFEQYGAIEGRDPSLLFSDSKYLAANPDVKAARINPLLHYIQYGLPEGRLAFVSGNTAVADPLVDAPYLDKQLGATLVPAGAAGQQQAASRYHTSGWQAGLNPDAFFDTHYYLSHNADVTAAHIDPLQHYEQYGWHEGRNPSMQFSVSKYLAAYSDVKAAQIDPLAHFLIYGRTEGRTVFAV